MAAPSRWVQRHHRQPISRRRAAGLDHPEVAPSRRGHGEQPTHTIGSLARAAAKCPRRGRGAAFGWGVSWSALAPSSQGHHKQPTNTIGGARGVAAGGPPRGAGARFGGGASRKAVPLSPRGRRQYDQQIECAGDGGRRKESCDDEQVGAPKNTANATPAHGGRPQESGGVQPAGPPLTADKHHRRCGRGGTKVPRTRWGCRLGGGGAAGELQRPAGRGAAKEHSEHNAGVVGGPI